MNEIARSWQHDATAMDTPRILAIEDVHLSSSPAAEADLRTFYTGLLGLDVVEEAPGPSLVGFRGYPRSGPQLIVSITTDPQGCPPRRQLLVQVASLRECAEVLSEHGIGFEWSQGWSFCDRRLSTQDPAGNRVELVSYHPL